MKCINPDCMKEIADGSVFCKYCGTKQDSKILENDDIKNHQNHQNKPRKGKQNGAIMGSRTVRIALFWIVLLGCCFGIAYYSYIKERFSVDTSSVQSNLEDKENNHDSIVAVQEQIVGNCIHAQYYNYSLSEEDASFLDSIVRVAQSNGDIKEMNGIVFLTQPMNHLWNNLDSFAKENNINTTDNDINSLGALYDTVHFVFYNDYKIRIQYNSDTDYGDYLIIITPLTSGKGYIYGYSYSENPSYLYCIGECSNGMFNGEITGETKELLGDIYSIRGNVRNGLRDGEWEEILISSQYDSSLKRKTCTFLDGQTEYVKTNNQYSGETEYQAGDAFNDSGERIGAYERMTEDQYAYYYKDRRTYWGIGDMNLNWNFKYSVLANDMDAKVRLGY